MSAKCMSASAVRVQSVHLLELICLVLLAVHSLTVTMIKSMIKIMIKYVFVSEPGCVWKVFDFLGNICSIWEVRSISSIVNRYTV